MKIYTYWLGTIAIERGKKWTKQCDFKILALVKSHQIKKMLTVQYFILHSCWSLSRLFGSADKGVKTSSNIPGVKKHKSLALKLPNLLPHEFKKIGHSLSNFISRTAWKEIWERLWKMQFLRPKRLSHMELLSVARDLVNQRHSLAVPGVVAITNILKIFEYNIEYFFPKLSF